MEQSHRRDGVEQIGKIRFLKEMDLDAGAVVFGSERVGGELDQV